MSQIPKTVGINIGKNSFHVVGRDERGAIVLRQKWSPGQLEARVYQHAAVSGRLGGVRRGAKLKALGHDARLMPAKYVRTYFFSKQLRFYPNALVRYPFRVRLCFAY